MYNNVILYKFQICKICINVTNSKAEYPDTIVMKLGDEVESLLHAAHCITHVAHCKSDACSTARTYGMKYPSLLTNSMNFRHKLIFKHCMT